jgi:hypothetical protein
MAPLSYKDQIRIACTFYLMHLNANKLKRREVLELRARLRNR